MDKYVKVDNILDKLNELDYYYQYGSEGKVSPRTVISKVTSAILDCPLEAVVQATSRNTMSDEKDKDNKRKILMESNTDGE